MAVLLPVPVDTAGPAHLHGQLLAGGVPHQLAPLLLHVLGGAGRLVEGGAHLGPRPVTHLLDRAQAPPHSLVKGLLGEGDGTLLVKVFLADLLRCGLEGGDVGVVTRLYVPGQGTVG